MVIGIHGPGLLLCQECVATKNRRQKVSKRTLRHRFPILYPAAEAVLAIARLNHWRKLMRPVPASPIMTAH